MNQFSWFIYLFFFSSFEIKSHLFQVSLSFASGFRLIRRLIRRLQWKIIIIIYYIIIIINFIIIIIIIQLLAKEFNK